MTGKRIVCETFFSQWAYFLPYACTRMWARSAGTSSDTILENLTVSGQLTYSGVESAALVRDILQF